ncbi:peptidoglycan-binding protein LysM [Gelidibacter sp.]|uniref:peptidoglycan-binding protein LysM n=1 Tax=Gelidibacter sp. TaxID=2018083 RepID=UPI003263D6B2
MGLFSFIKNAGPKVFGLGKKDSEENDTDQLKKTATRKLEETIKDLQLHVENLKIKIDDDMATVLGKAQDQSTKEKVVLLIGNTSGIASVDDQMSVDHAEPEAQFYTVIKGDTLEKIAKQYYGNAMSYPLIFDANKPILTSPDKLFTGQVLRIPIFE